MVRGPVVITLELAMQCCNSIYVARLYPDISRLYLLSVSVRISRSTMMPTACKHKQQDKWWSQEANLVAPWLHPTTASVPDLEPSFLTCMLRGNYLSSYPQVYLVGSLVWPASVSSASASGAIQENRNRINRR